MYGLFSAGLEVMASAFVLVPVFLIINWIKFHDLKRTGLYCLFSFYLVAVWSLVGMPNVTYIRFEANLQLIPFVPTLSDIRNTILNVLLFIPLGFFLPILWKKYESKRNTIIFGLGTTLTIEICQMLTFRATDINDVITNVAGTIIGWYTARFLLKKVPGITGLIEKKMDRDEYLICTVTVLVMFFVQPFISSVLWELVL